MRRRPHRQLCEPKAGYVHRFVAEINGRSPSYETPGSLVSCFLPSSICSLPSAEIKTISLAVRCGQVTEARRSCTDRSRWHGCWMEALEGQDTPVLDPRGCHKKPPQVGGFN